MMRHPFGDKPIPDMKRLAALKQGYRDMPIDRAADEYEAGCDDARNAGIAGHNLYADNNSPPYYTAMSGAIEQLYLRRPVIDKLLAVNAGLQKYGLEIYLFDAWRPDAIQRYCHDKWFPEWLGRRHPQLGKEQIAAETELYWAAPTNDPDSPAPHLTGAAVDMSLRRRDNGQTLFMGSIVDELTAPAATDHYEQELPVAMSDEAAQINRRILYWSMIEQGFVNNPTEWWHYSYGDQMWAKLSGGAAAIFGACNPLRT